MECTALVLEWLEASSAWGTPDSLAKADCRKKELESHQRIAGSESRVCTAKTSRNCSAALALDDCGNSHNLPASVYSCLARDKTTAWRASLAAMTTALCRDCKTEK